MLHSGVSLDTWTLALLDSAFRVQGAHAGLGFRVYTGLGFRLRGACGLLCLLLSL